jgi:hypothetical protein
MDLDHPQYRRTTAPEEKLSTEPGADDTSTETPKDEDK